MGSTDMTREEKKEQLPMHSYLKLLSSQSLPDAAGNGTKEAHAQQEENNLEREREFRVSSISD